MLFFCVILVDFFGEFKYFRWFFVKRIRIRIIREPDWNEFKRIRITIVCFLTQHWPAEVAEGDGGVPNHGEAGGPETNTVWCNQMETVGKYTLWDAISSELII